MVLIMFNNIFKKSLSLKFSSSWWEQKGPKNKTRGEYFPTVHTVMVGLWIKNPTQAMYVKGVQG